MKFGKRQLQGQFIKIVDNIVPTALYKTVIPDSVWLCVGFIIMS